MNRVVYGTLLTFRKIFLFVSSQDIKMSATVPAKISKQMAVFKESDWHKLVSELSVCLIIWKKSVRLVIFGALARLRRATIN